MRVLSLGALLLSCLPGCGGDGGGADAADPADAPVSVPDAAPQPDAPPVPDAPAANGDGYPRGDGGVLVCGSKDFFESCSDGVECASCLCYDPTGSGSSRVCSKSCEGDEDCPPTSSGCHFTFCQPP